LPIAPLRYDGGAIVVGTVSLTLGLTNNLRSDLELCTNSDNRVVLKTGKKSFALGPRTNPVDHSGRVDLDFLPEPGDSLLFTTHRSLIGWPTPFEIHWLSSRSPWWKRYVYYTLTWKKASGAVLKMRWRYEQQYYTATGWTTPEMMWNSQTGLLTIAIAE